MSNAYKLCPNLLNFSYKTMHQQVWQNTLNKQQRILKILPNCTLPYQTGLFFPDPAFDGFETHLQDTKSTVNKQIKESLNLLPRMKKGPRKLPFKQP